jgi:hypothetical protein
MEWSVVEPAYPRGNAPPSTPETNTHDIGRMLTYVIATRLFLLVLQKKQSNEFDAHAVYLLIYKKSLHCAGCRAYSHDFAKLFGCSRSRHARRSRSSAVLPKVIRSGCISHS